MVLFPYLIYLGLIVWIYWLWTRRHFYTLMLKIPGRLGYPILGMGHEFMQRKKILDFINQNSEKYGSIFLTWMGIYPFLVITEPDLVKDIFTSPDCIKKSKAYEAFNDGIGKGLLSLSDPEWSVHRKYMNQAFSHNVLLNYMPKFNEEVNKFVAIFQSKVNENNSMDLIKILEDFVSSTAIKTTLGTSTRQDYHESQKKLIENIYWLKERVADMLFFPWLRIEIIQKLLGIYEPFQRARAEARQFGRELIETKMLKAESNLKSNNTDNVFLDYAIDFMRKGIFSLQAVEDESFTLVLAASETTSRTIAHTLVMLAMFPEYQQKLFEELQTIFPQTGEFEVTADNLRDMVYIDMVINETMRVLTPTPIISRENTRALQLSNGIVLPAGIQIAINMFGIHRRVDIWGQEAHIFNPDNMIPSNMVNKHPYAFIPFAKGQRNCIGRRYGLMLIKVTLAKLLRNFEFTTDFRYEDLRFYEEITLQLKEMPLLNVVKRKV